MSNSEGLGVSGGRGDMGGQGRGDGSGHPGGRGRGDGQGRGNGQGRRGQPKGRQVDDADLARLECILGNAPRRADLLIEHLHRIQDAEGCLPAPLLAALARVLRLTQVDVFEVATFYHHFDVVREGEPRPAPLTVRVCDSLSCEMAGARSLIERLAASAGDRVRVQPVPCVGRCAGAPVAVVGQRPLERTDEAQVLAALGGPRECPTPVLPGDAQARVDAGYPVLRALRSGARDANDVLQTLDAAGLRGMGGAGFPVARKWRAVAAEPGPRLMVINADEGEPGTFKDRHFLETEPHRVLEGALIAARIVGCDEVYLYLRDEYAGVRALLEREIAVLADSGLCGAGAAPRIHLRRGAGAYVCGEESALIESLEGKRGEPRMRPPYVAQKGLFGRPTLVNNVETLWWIPQVLERGAQWFASQGRRGRKGLRAFSVSGRVREPGVKIAPAGISLRELVDEYCGGMADGHVLAAYLPGGASGGILPASLADLALDFDVLQAHGAFIGSAAIVVLSECDDLRDAALNLMRFFRAESCGQCTPCRVGCEKAVTLLERDAQGAWDEPLLRDLAGVMMDASICGLGQAAPNPFMSVIRHFPRVPTQAGASTAGKP